MSKTKGNNFQQFIKKEDTGARLKEKIRQEKKKARQETQAFFARKKQAARQGLAEGPPAQRENIQKLGSYSAQKKPTSRKPNISQPGSRSSLSIRSTTRSSKPEAGASRSNVPQRSSRPSSSARTAASPSKQQAARASRSDISQSKSSSSIRLETNPSKQPAAGASKTNSSRQIPTGKPTSDAKHIAAVEKPATGNTMPLNKFLAHAGISSRRDAADIVRSGKVSVNGQIITEPGFKVSEKDDIRAQGQKLSARKHLVYILLNKPKDHITTMEDPQGRKTVMDLVKKATPERVYPVGRLDRNTTGVLLLTNDGDLAQKLSHPRYEVRKIYEVTLDKPMIKKDFETMQNGITLEDGFVRPDALAFADAKDRSVIGIEIHSGKNRIVRRMFEQLGYDVRNLDRVMYANLTKKNVERGKWRFLAEKEIRLLKFMNASYAKKHKEAVQKNIGKK